MISDLGGVFKVVKRDQMVSLSCLGAIVSKLQISLERAGTRFRFKGVFQSLTISISQCVMPQLLSFARSQAS